jgi:hypothetical protein
MFAGRMFAAKAPIKPSGGVCEWRAATVPSGWGAFCASSPASTRPPPAGQNDLPQRQDILFCPFVQSCFRLSTSICPSANNVSTDPEDEQGPCPRKVQGPRGRS